MKLPAQIEIVERTNKTGEPYKVVIVRFVDLETGEMVSVFENYLRPHQEELLKYLYAKTNPTLKK